MSIYRTEDTKRKMEFWREGWDVERNPGFPLSYEVHRGRKFLALRSDGGWFQNAVALQESILISPHEILAKVQIGPRGQKRALSHISAQLAVKAVALHKARQKALGIGFSEEQLDWEVDDLADEYAIRPGKDMVRYLALMMGGYSQDRTERTMKRMRHWGKWKQKDDIEAMLGGFYNEAYKAIAEGDIPTLAMLLEEHGEGAEKSVGKGSGGSSDDDEDEEGEYNPSDWKEGDHEPGGMDGPLWKDKWVLPQHATIPTSWWGPMKIVRPPLIAQQQIIKRVYTRKSADSGCTVGDISRILSDQKVFRESRPTIKGSVLIDGSGSMSLSHEEIYRICSEIPGAIIGVYGGRGGGGKLIIAGMNGRLIEKQTLAKEREGYGANIVDGPALEWLEHQPRPRVWVSDGAVTGVGDGTNTAVVEDAKRIRTRAHITRIHALKKAPGVIKYLRAKRE